MKNLKMISLAALTLLTTAACQKTQAAETSVLGDGYEAKVGVGYYKDDVLESEGTTLEAEIGKKISTWGPREDVVRAGISTNIDSGVESYGAHLGYAYNAYPNVYVVPRIGVEHFRDESMQDGTAHKSGNYMKYSLGLEYDMKFATLDGRIGYAKQFDSNDLHDRDGKLVMVGLSKKF